MVRPGKRRTRRKLEPLIPEAPDELNLPKYFNIIRSGGYGGAKSGEKRSEEMLPPMPGPNETPKALRTRRSLLPRDQYPNPAPEPERLPLLARLKYHFVSLFKVEPERPKSMPKVPELNFPALYTRFPVMKTVTKTTDAAGEIAVTYAQSYATIPGVVITVKDPDNVFGTVFSTTLTGFEVRLFKMDHDHGGVVDNGGKHTPTINPDGYHVHDVTGSLSWTENGKYGRLVMANYTDYEKDHVHTQVQTQLEASPKHTHGIYATGSAGSHGHSAPSCGVSNNNKTAVTSIGYGSSCDTGKCVDPSEVWGHSMALSSHYHTIGSIGSAGAHTHSNGTSQPASSHRHLLNPTGGVPGLGHRHLMSDDLLYQHYIYSITGVNLSLLVTAVESPYHAHSGEEIPWHKHAVPSDGRVLLKNTDVTITYLAQEESS
jgi:hypothetical protein